MPKRKQKRGGKPLMVEYVERDPVLHSPGHWSPRHSCQTYNGVHYMNQIFRPGDHVVLHNGDSPDTKPLICEIDVLYECEEEKVPMFKGRWFWSPQDVRDNQPDRGRSMRQSRDEKHEMIISDQRESNLAETISRRCVILNWENFETIAQVIGTDHPLLNGIYFCDRMYYHKALTVQECVSGLFPGASPETVLEHLDTREEFHTGQMYDAEIYKQSKLQMKKVVENRNDGCTVNTEEYEKIGETRHIDDGVVEDYGREEAGCTVDVIPSMADPVRIYKSKIAGEAFLDTEQTEINHDLSRPRTCSLAYTREMNAITPSQGESIQKKPKQAMAEVIDVDSLYQDSQSSA